MSMKDKPIVTANWDAQVTKIFCQICVEESEAGNKPHGGLSAKGYQNLAEKFRARTGRPYTQKQLKNRWDAPKSLYDFWLSLLQNTGLGWDGNLGTVTASDDFWALNTKGNKERKALRFGPPDNLDLLGKMFDKSKVSGLSACIPGEERQTSHINLDDEEENSENTMRKAVAMQGLKRKATTSSPVKKGKNPMVKVMKKMVDDVISSNSITSQALSGDLTRNDIREVMQLAKDSGAVEGSDEHYMATKLFVKSENRDVFLTFESNEARLNWLKRCYEERKN